MTYELLMGAANRPRDDKISDGGDDAWFTTNSIFNSAGVADGVGSWRSRGINAGICARQLMSSTRQFLLDHPNNTNPEEALSVAVSQLTAEGTTTALVAILDETGFLNVAQIGDSDLVVFRNDCIVFETQSQQHSFNYPYQIGRGLKYDVVEDAQTYTFMVEPDDIIVLGTDGLWDNLYPSDVLQIVSGGEASPRLLAQLVADSAYEASQNPDLWSPFAQSAYESKNLSGNYRKYLGGKQDDITVVVCRVSQ